MPGSPEADLIDQAWGAVCGDDPDAPEPAPLDVTGAPSDLRSPLPVERTAVACVAAAIRAAASLHHQRGSGLPAVSVDRGHVADAVRSERYFRGAASAGTGFAPLSRFWSTEDGWIRTHANYPWHRSALLDALGAHDVDAVASAIAGLRAEQVEERVFAAGGIAAAVRSLETWRGHPQGRAVAAEPLIGHQSTGEGSPRSRSESPLPASGIRVLDLTRVIAGPVCTRFLGALGADVLRLDPPHRPDMVLGVVADTLLGKHSAVLDFRSPAAVDTLHALLGKCDVVVCGHRPGALDRFGLGEERLVQRHPGLVIVYLDAWGHRGPWRARRGFDSVVQAPTGIAATEGDAAGDPGSLPCQLLDHGTGYLAAAAALDGLRRQAMQGGTHVRRLSLARTAWWLTSQRVESSAEPKARSDRPSWLVELDGSVTAVAPPGTIGDQPLRWPGPPTRYGSEPPAWG